MKRMRTGVATAAIALLATGASCASLGSLIQPPTFAVADGRSTELRLLGPSTSRPLGGASLRVWTRIGNPNSFGLTLAALAGNIYLENQQAGEVTFPLGLPLLAGGDTIVPLDINISFADVPGLAGVAQQILLQNQVSYRLDGTVTVDAGPFGRPSFGPRTWVRGDTRVMR
ncbi:MAG: LEA type 2 family protein [Gemmatimonadota bacterium]